MKKNLAIKVPIFFTTLIAASLLILKLFGDSLPVAVTNVLSMSYFLFLPLNFILKPMGMWEGEIWSGPTVLGLIIGVMIYDLILFALARAMK